MSNKIELSLNVLNALSLQLANEINATYGGAEQVSYLQAYGIPRGGVPALLAVRNHLKFKIAESAEEADFFIDDIIDSGGTMKKYRELFPQKPFFAIINKMNRTFCAKVNIQKDTWIIFPWESNNTTNNGLEDNILRIFQYIGEDPSREGLLETPKRYQKALDEWFSGYAYTEQMIQDELKTFEDGAEGCDQMVIRHNIPLYSHCEHHIAAIIGSCTIAYIPKNKVLGLSKMDRLVEIFARRLQVQERLTNQIADAMWKYLEPVGVGVYINARHMCVESRGVKNLHSETATLALRGAFKNQHETRAEFLSAVQK